MILNELSDKDYDLVWNAFEKNFDFKPSVKPEDWPAINEPSPSYTIHFPGDIIGEYPDKQELDVLFIQAFNQLMGKSKIKYLLDWCHKCYYAPEKFEDYSWVLPNGDYYICLNEGFQVGTFGHPWERTICVFGEELIRLTRNYLPVNYDRIIREHLTC